jgi:hypothetical protein
VYTQKFFVIKIEECHVINPLNAELNSICHLLALLGAHHILHVTMIGVKEQLTEFTPSPDTEIQVELRT